MERTEAKWYAAISAEYRNYWFTLFQREGNLILYILGTDGSRRKNHEQTWTDIQSILHGPCPPLPRSNIQLIQPHRRPSCLQIFRQPQRKLRILTRIADKSGLRLRRQMRIPEESV